LKKILIYISIGLLSITTLYFYLQPEYLVFHDFNLNNGASRSTSKDLYFTEWWYFDGEVNNNLSFVLTFWHSKKGNWIELTLYDSKKGEQTFFHYNFTDEEIKISKSECKVDMGSNNLLKENGIYLVKIDNPDLCLQL